MTYFSVSHSLLSDPSQLFCLQFHITSPSFLHLLSPIGSLYWPWELCCVTQYTPLSKQLYLEIFIAMSHWSVSRPLSFATASVPDLHWDGYKELSLVVRDSFPWWHGYGRAGGTIAAGFNELFKKIIPNRLTNLDEQKVYTLDWQILRWVSYPYIANVLES